MENRLSTGNNPPEFIFPATRYHTLIMSKFAIYRAETEKRCLPAVSSEIPSGLGTELSLFSFVYLSGSML